MADLKPYPCCGGAARLEPRHVQCWKCGLMTLSFKHNVDAIAAWNRRVPVSGLDVLKVPG